MSKRPSDAIAPSLDHVLDVYFSFMLKVDPQMDKKINAMVQTLKDKHGDKDALFNEISAQFPTFGHPMDFYTEVYLKKNGDRTSTDAENSTKKKKKGGAVKIARNQNKQRHVTGAARGKEGSIATSPSTPTPHLAGPKKKVQIRTNESAVVVQEEKKQVVATVAVASKSPAAEKIETRPSTYPTTLKDALLDAFARDRAKGWRAKDLEAVNLPRVKRKEMMTRDVFELRGLLSATNSEAKSQRHNVRNKRGSFDKRDGKFSPLTMRYLSFAWGVGKNQPSEMIRKATIPLEDHAESCECLMCWKEPAAS